LVELNSKEKNSVDMKGKEKKRYILILCLTVVKRKNNVGKVTSEIQRK